MTGLPPRRLASALDPALERRGVLVAVLAAALTALGLWLRLHGLGAQSLWLDEILQAHATRRSLAWTLSHMATDKPPLDYLIQHAVIRLLGSDREAALRLHAALFGALTLPVVFLWGRSAFGPAAGLCALAVLAVSPLHLRYSQEGRPYALFALLTALSSWSLWELTGRSRARARWWALHAAATWASLWTLSLSLLTAALQQAWIWGRAFSQRAASTGHQIRAVAWGSLAVALLSTLTLAPLAGRLLAAARETPPYGFDPLTGATLLRNLNTFAFGHSVDEQLGGAFLWALPLLLVGLTWGRRRGAALALLLLLAVGNFAVPLALCAWANHWFEVRYALGALVPLTLILGAGAAGFAALLARLVTPARRRSAAEAALLTVAALGGGGAAVSYQLTSPHQKTDWRGVADYLARQGDAPPRVLLAHPWHQFQLDFYLERERATVVTEVHTEPPLLIQRAADLGGAFVLIPQRDATGPLFHWLWGQPMPPLRTPGLWLWWTGDPTALLRSPAALAEATARFEADGFRLALGDEAFPALGAGWGVPERFEGDFPFRWMARDRATLLLPLREPRAVRIIWRAMTFAWEGAPVQWTVLRLNGLPVGQGVTEPGAWRTYGATASAEVWHTGLNALTFEIDHAVPPQAHTGIPDPRRLGIAVTELKLTPLEEAAPVDILFEVPPAANARERGGENALDRPAEGP